MSTNILKQIQVISGAPEKYNTEVLVLFRFEGEANLNLQESVLDEKSNRQIKRSIRNGDFKGRANETLMLYPGDEIRPDRLLLVGLGKPAHYSLETTRLVAATVARKLQKMELQDFTIFLPALFRENTDAFSIVREFVVGTQLSLYKFTELKSKREKTKTLEAVYLLTDSQQDLEKLQQAVEVGKNIARGVYLTRDLVNWPSNFATPSFLADQAETLAKSLNLKVEVFSEEKIASLGMGAFCGVTRGTDEPAKFIILEHNSEKLDLETIVLIGKGVTFDSGGISIKPAEGMERMKSDMGGAAAVMGAMMSAALLEIPLHVVALIPATENMLSGKSYKPADVVKAMNGKTIEVISTDAEGRLLLADALCFAAQYGAKAVIDIATLTGARTIALGDYAIGLFSNSVPLARKLEFAGQITFERVWQLPLFDEYKKVLESYVADIKHSGGKSGGAIVAAKFLQEFVDGYDWAHLDIAGLVSDEKNEFYTPGWATGIGCRLLIQFLSDWAS